ncbi:MAG: YbjN domain-containing protein [Cyanobacteriota bacterium]|nr:YbjN domain-containing protein [Cyanobacteriota bacterium]
MELTLTDSSNSPIPLQVTHLALVPNQDTPNECRLTFDVTPQLYRQLETAALLNLKPETRNAQTAVNFQPAPNLQIEASLHPTLVPQLVPHASQLLDYLAQLNATQPNHPLFSSENWFALSVKQAQNGEEIGYRTIWSYISPSLFVRDDLSETELSATIQNSFQTWASDTLEAFGENTSTEVVGEFTRNLENLMAQEIDSIAARATAELTAELAAAFQTSPNQMTNNSTAKPPSLLMGAIAFFTEDDWTFTRVEGETALRLGFEGDNGEWNCYAQVDEEDQQIMFYSIWGDRIPENQRLIMAEFLTRANYGLIMGNFEMDFNDGEVRYKTSLDIEGGTLTPSLIKRIVYPNVLMMDKYLPGIEAVMKGEKTPEEAIAQIENP